MGVGVLLGATAVGAVMVAQIETRTVAQANDASESGILAASAVEYTLQKMAANPNWRTTYMNNVETAPVPLGRGTISFKLVDENDGNLANNTSDPVRVYGIGRVGKATRVYSVKCGPGPVSSLKVAMSINGAINFGLNGYTILGSATISSNSTITGTLTNLGSTNLEAAGLITLTTPTGGGYRKSNQPVKDLPDPAHVFDYYIGAGRKMSGIPTNGSGLQITRVLISPTSNPFGGGLQPQGIYVIDCGGSSIIISSCRIVGTLVLLNCGGANLQTQLNWEPTIAGYPALLVQGNLTWKTNTTVLSESVTPVVNFNPAGTPYPYNYGLGTGTINNTTTDTYPTQIAGIVYCTGAFDSNSGPVLKKGLIIGGNGNWAPTGNIDLTYDPTPLANPPPGFLSANLAPMSGTWRREQAP
jgi:hypothetical protein